MIPHIKAGLVFILLILSVSSFSGSADGFKDGAKLPYPNSPDNMRTMARKLIGIEAMLDYEKPGSNGAHTPPDNGGKDAGGKRKGVGINN